MEIGFVGAARQFGPQKGADEATVVLLVERLELLEWLAELYWRSSSMGTPHILTDKDFEAIIMSAMEKGYGSIKKVEKK